MRKTRSVSFRLAIRFSLLLTAATLLMAVAFSATLGFMARNQQNQELENSTEVIQKALENQGLDNSSDFNQLPYYVTYVVYEPDSGQTVSTNDPYLPFLQETEGRAKSYYDEDYFLDGALNILYYAKAVDIEDKELIIETALNMDTDSTIKMMRQLPKVAVIAFIPILILSFLFALFITKRTLSPVVKMTSTAKKIGSTNLDVLLPLKHNVPENYDELDDLAFTFNDLFKRLKSDFDREKQFTSDVSHELKTPVAVILGQSNLLRRWGKDDPVQLEKSLGTIIAETKSMEAIITNLLQMSRLESGKIKPQIDKVDLLAMYQRLKDETLTVNPNIEFEIKKDFDSDAVCMADAELLHQVLTVVTSNTLKFCSAAEINPIKITAEIQDKKGHFLLSLCDNGPGFPSEALPHVFERFYRGDSAHTRSAGGSGLGLSIAKTIIECMNGKIWAENDSQNGLGGAKILILL